MSGGQAIDPRSLGDNHEPFICQTINEAKILQADHVPDNAIAVHIVIKVTAFYCAKTFEPLGRSPQTVDQITEVDLASARPKKIDMKDLLRMARQKPQQQQASAAPPPSTISGGGVVAMDAEAKKSEEAPTAPSSSYATRAAEKKQQEISKVEAVVVKQHSRVPPVRCVGGEKSDVVRDEEWHRLAKKADDYVASHNEKVGKDQMFRIPPDIRFPEGWTPFKEYQEAWKFYLLPYLPDDDCNNYLARRDPETDDIPGNFKARPGFIPADPKWRPKFNVWKKYKDRGYMPHSSCNGFLKGKYPHKFKLYQEGNPEGKTPFKCRPDFIPDDPKWIERVEEFLEERKRLEEMKQPSERTLEDVAIIRIKDKPTSRHATPQKIPPPVAVASRKVKEGGARPRGWDVLMNSTSPLTPAPPQCEDHQHAQGFFPSPTRR